MAQKALLEIGYQAAQLVLLLAGAPLLEGFCQKLGARLSGRRGPPLLGEYSELRKLLAKESLLSSEASPASPLGPLVAFGAAVAAATLVPVFYAATLGGVVGDALALVGLLLLGRFAMALTAQDGGAPLPALSASRDLSLLALSLPPLLLSLLAVSLPAGTTSLAQVTQLASGAQGGLVFGPGRVLALLAFAAVVFGETARAPQGAGPLRELGLFGEGAALELGGRLYGLWRYAAQLRRLILYALLANLFLPFGPAGSTDPEEVALSAGLFLGKLLLLAVGYACAERAALRARFFRLPELFAVALGIAILASLAAVEA